MAESTLAFEYTTLRVEVAYVAGYGRDSTLWSSDQSSIINQIINSGLRQFYWPDPVPGYENYEWSFLHPIGKLITVSGQADYDAPDDFGSLEGEFTYSSNSGYGPIIDVGEGSIRNLRQGSSVTGAPDMVGVSLKKTTGVVGSRWEFMFYPTPGAIYTIEYPYSAIPNALSEKNPYPLGGAQHADTILESCLSITEGRLGDFHGVHNQLFKERLLASLQKDARLGPRVFGRNSNGSRITYVSTRGLNLNGTEI